MISIENEYIKVGILEYGAELCSYIDKQNKREVIWNGDSKYWKRHSPILFPLVGKIENGQYKLGKKNRVPIIYVFSERLTNRKGFDIHLGVIEDDFYNLDEKTSADYLNKKIE